MNSIRSAAILVALVTSACSAGTVSPSVVPSSPPAAASPGASASATPSSPLEGTWATGVVTCEDKIAALHEAGLTDADIANAGTFCSEPGQEVIRFAAGRLLSFNHDGSVGWDGLYRIVDEDTFEAGDNGTYYITYHYAVDGDELAIEVIEDRCPGCTSEASRLGELAAQIAGYNTAPFTRQD